MKTIQKSQFIIFKLYFDLLFFTLMISLFFNSLYNYLLIKESESIYLVALKLIITLISLYYISIGLCFIYSNIILYRVLNIYKQSKGKIYANIIFTFYVLMSLILTMDYFVINFYNYKYFIFCSLLFSFNIVVYLLIDFLLKIVMKEKYNNIVQLESNEKINEYYYEFKLFNISFCIENLFFNPFVCILNGMWIYQINNRRIFLFSRKNDLEQGFYEHLHYIGNGFFIS